MLAQLRSLTRGIVAYVLLFLLVVAFAIWGINDVFRGVGSQNLADVGGRKVTPAMLSRELDLTLRGERNQGNNISQEEAIQAGLHRRILESLIARNAMYAYAEKVGVAASDRQVADRIRQIPNVLNPVTGAFDQDAYRQFLATLGYSQSEFEHDIRGDMTTQMLMGTLVAGIRAPSSFGELAFVYQGETRTVTIAEAPASVAGTIAAPTEAQLQTFYQESAEQLRVPEFRALTLVYARVGDFVGRVNVPDERIRQEFESRRAALTQPEKRSYVRIAAQNQAQANDAAARLARGETPEAIASALGVQATRGENQARTEVPDSRVAEAVFTTQPRSAPRVVQGELSPWVVIQVTALTPAVEPSFEAQRAELRTAIAQEEASDLLNTAIGAFEDARAAGTAIADAARQNGLAVVTVPATTAQGQDRSGAPVAALADQAELLRTAFQTPEGEASDFMPVGDADVLVTVDRIIPESTRPFAEVRADLQTAWIGRERANRLREAGAHLAEAVRGGTPFAQAARAAGFQIRISSQAINRQMAGQIPSRGLGAQIFNGAEGAVVTDLRVDGEAVLAAVVEHINRPDPAAAPQVVEAARAQLQQSISNSFGEALQAQVVEAAQVRRNDQLLSRMYPSQNADEEQQ